MLGISGGYRSGLGAGITWAFGWRVLFSELENYEQIALQDSVMTPMAMM
jgi:hypothetical protein